MRKREPKARHAQTQARLCRRPDLQLNPLEDGCVVYQPDQERVHFLNRTAALVLALCDGHNGYPEIEQQVAAAHALHESGRSLTGEILQQFIAAGLVSVEAGAPAAA